jgi:hypothetical protein
MTNAQPRQRLAARLRWRIGGARSRKESEPYINPMLGLSEEVSEPLTEKRRTTSRCSALRPEMEYWVAYHGTSRP